LAQANTRLQLFAFAVGWKMVSHVALASDFGVAFDCSNSEDLSIMNGERLQITGTASVLVDSSQFSHETFSLAGDPYPEFDRVTRSFDPNSVANVVFKTIPSDDALGMALSDDMLAAWTGHEVALNLDCNNKWHENCSHNAIAMVPVDNALAAWMERKTLVNLECNNKSLESHTVPYSRRFQATDVPPGVPLNVCFRLQPTTYWLHRDGAHVIANVLLDFLTAKVTTTITKVSHAKFSIKVNICIDGSDCVAKLRLYSNNANRALALELQRRSGCGLVFNRFYQEVGCFLAACQESVQLKLLNALECGSSPVWANADVRTDGMAEPAALMLACSQTCRMEAEACIALHNVPQFA